MPHGTGAGDANSSLGHEKLGGPSPRSACPRTGSLPALGNPGANPGAAEPAPPGLRGTKAQGTRIWRCFLSPLAAVVPGKVTAMKRALIPALVLAAVAGIALPAAPADAQMVCGKRTDMVRQLSEKYGETRRSMGLADGRGYQQLQQ